MKKFLCVLAVILAVMALATGGLYGYILYRNSHIFIEGQAYPLDAESLDLRDKNLSVEDYRRVQEQLPGCSIVWMVPFQGEKHSSDVTELAVTELNQADLELVGYFPALKKVDATACEEYALLKQLQEKFPACQVVYQVNLGGSSYPLDAAALELNSGDYTYGMLLENLAYLPSVQTVKLRMPELTREQLAALEEAYADVAFQCTVELLGVEYDTQTEQLNLSALQAEDVAETAEKLAMLPELASVELMDSAGKSQLSKEDVKTLMAAASGVTFHYTFDFYGTTLSTADEEVKLANKRIGDQGEQELRLALDLLPNCKRFVLDNCHFSDDVLAKVRDDYREQTKVVWRIWFGKNGSCLTDVETVRAVYGLTDKNCGDLVYCEDVVYADLGHNEFLEVCDFVAGMPNLEYIILSGSPIKDLTPFENCKKLKFLEIAYCEYLEDASPLKNCENLEMLNISNTHITDLTPLDDLPLITMFAKVDPSGRSRIPQEEQQRFQQQHPDCDARFGGTQPYGEGWRTDKSGKALPHYARIAAAFKYPKAYNNTGIYLSSVTIPE